MQRERSCRERERGDTEEITGGEREGERGEVEGTEGAKERGEREKRDR